MVLVHISNGKKLENWQHPEVQGSIQPEAKSAASRNPKVFFGVRHGSLIDELEGKKY